VLYRDASGALKTDGALTVGGTFTATIGSLSGGSNGLALNAGGTNQSITLTPSGSGATLFNGNVGIGTTSPSSAKLVVASPQATGNNTVIAEFTKSGGVNTYGSAILRLSRGVGGESMDAELNSGGSGPFRYGTYSDSLFVNNQNATNGPYGSIHFVTNLAPRLTIGGGTLAGNVGIGTTSPSAKLEIAGPAARVIVRIGSEDISATFPERLSLYARSTGPDTEANEYGPKISFRTLWGGTENEVAYIAGFNDYAWKAGMAFGVKPQGNGQLPVPVMTIRESGNVGIGTTTPTHKLAVNGTIKAKEVLIDSTGWADYVFAEDYRLAPRAEVEQHIREKKHLPGIPSAAEVATQGVSLGDMQAKLLSKIEELTLHLIRLEQENGSLRERVQKLEAKALPLP